MEHHEGHFDLPKWIFFGIAGLTAFPVSLKEELSITTTFLAIRWRPSLP